MGDGRTYVVGDIHGCLDELNVLLEHIHPGSEDHICFLGDYVDRGPSAMGVIDRLIDLRGDGTRCTFLKGNHEDMFLSYLGFPGLYGESFLYNGGGKTLESYGITGRSGEAAARMIPAEHRDFLLSLEYEIRKGEFLCVHAGLRPTAPLDEQSNEDRVWIREEFISVPHEFPFTILFGHTPQREVFLDLPYKVGLDTGLVYGNKLSCLELGDKRLLQVRRGAREVTEESLESTFAAADRLTSRSHFV